MRRMLSVLVGSSLLLGGCLEAAAADGPQELSMREQGTEPARPFGRDAADLCEPYLRPRAVMPPVYSPPVAAPPMSVPQGGSADVAAPVYVPPPLAPPPAPVVITGSRIVGPSMTSPVPVTVVGSAENRERYSDNEVAGVQSVADAPVSTFGVDVDTGSYANVRRMLTDGRMPPQDAVRTEELLNYFRYDYPAPADRTRPFTVSADMAVTPWNPETRLLRIGLRGYDVARAERPPANLVFLVDVSGSMGSPDKLPLVKCSLALTAERLRPDDRVAIVVYAGAAGLVLEPTSDKGRVIDAIARLQAGGSTAGGAGLALAYATAQANMREGGVNRVLLATDGDFNVGVTRDETLVEMVERQAKSGVTLTTLGFGTGNYNESMMEQIADHGNGNYAYIDGPAEARKVLDDELTATLFTIAKDVKVQVEFNPAIVAEYRLIGYENRALREEDFANDAVDAGDIGAGHQVTALYELVPVGAKGWLPQREFAANRRVDGQGDRGGNLAVLKLRYKLPDGDTSRLLSSPISTAMLRRASAPDGDLAFVTAVAAYGQKLRGDPLLAGYDWSRVRALAGTPGEPLRSEFTGLVERAGRLDGVAPRSGG